MLSFLISGLALLLALLGEAALARPPRPGAGAWARRDDPGRALASPPAAR